MTRELKKHLVLPLSLLLTGCFVGHTAEVRRKALPPLPDPITRHTSRVFVQLPEELTRDSQCVAYEGYQTLCFEGVRAALETSLASLLWPSYPEVKLRRHADELTAGDYLLQVELTLDALPPDATRYGWSAGAKGRWRVVRDGMPLRGETLASRSRGDFAYGSGLGEAAGEVVLAVAAHIAQIMVQLPETNTRPPVLLPPVVAEDSFKPKAGGSPAVAAKTEEPKASATHSSEAQAKTEGSTKLEAQAPKR